MLAILLSEVNSFFGLVIESDFFIWLEDEINDYWCFPLIFFLIVIILCEILKRFLEHLSADVTYEGVGITFHKLLHRLSILFLILEEISGVKAFLSARNHNWGLIACEFELLVEFRGNIIPLLVTSEIKIPDSCFYLDLIAFNSWDFWEFSDVKSYELIDSIRSLLLWDLYLGKLVFHIWAFRK